MPLPQQETLFALANSVERELPPSYVEFVGKHDGAKPAANSFVTSDNEVGVSRFIPVAEAVDLAREIDGFPPQVIILAEDDCGNYFYVEPETGAVCFWDHEVDGADEQVAEDVSAFVAKLTPFDPERVELAPGQVRSAWVNPSFKPEF
jgi:hypothetical protein